ncbi:hypothetical protein ACIQXU_10190 [Peribacillus sp. NPDC097284]|uniref:hypothetical protein n=1 Tax=Peribacillus sp. NPDC097284 TaxID=3364401 RepID=UPI0037F82D49
MTGFIDAYQEKVGTFLFYSQTSIGYVKEGGGYPQLNTGYLQEGKRKSEEILSTLTMWEGTWGFLSERKDKDA